MNLPDFLRSCLEDTINNGDTDVPQADALLPGKHASATHRQESGVASSYSVVTPDSPSFEDPVWYVSYGSGCLKFEGSTQAEARAKAARYCCDDATARGNVR